MNAVEFCRWESDCFGFGYGSGEIHIMRELKAFFSLCKGENCQYDFKELEKFRGYTAAWFLINALCRSPQDRRLAKDSVIDYGTSPRFGWLSSFGKELKDFCDDKSPETLCDILGDYNAMDDEIYQVEPTQREG